MSVIKLLQFKPGLCKEACGPAHMKTILAVGELGEENL
jgi:hypothetical protein